MRSAKDIDTQTAKILLTKCKQHKMWALVFLIFGVGVFCYLYVTYLEGDVVQAFSRPAFVFFVIIPFIPAMIFSWLAHRIEHRLKNYLDSR